MPEFSTITKVMRAIGSNRVFLLLITPYRRYRRKSSKSARASIVALSGQNISAKSKFETIYKDRLWSKSSPTLLPSNSLSGHGSTAESTVALRSQLEDIFRAEGPEVFFDAPCGDFVWMKLVHFPESCGYIGGDIVQALIDELNKSESYAADLEHPRGPRFRKFIACDLTQSEFPQADFWLCKDCVQHLSNADIVMLLRNFARSSVKTALISNHTDVAQNSDINTGDFRHVDLTKPPFSLPPPRKTLVDRPVDGEQREIAVWNREDVLPAIGRLT